MVSRPNIDEETILKRYESFPPDVKDALMGITTADAIYEIGIKAHLNIEQTGLLAEEIGLITLGFVPAANFISDLKSTLGINEEKAQEIAEEANARVFLPIRESLKRIHGASWSAGLTKPPAKFEGMKGAETAQAAGGVVTQQGTQAPKKEERPREPLIISPLRNAPQAMPKEEAAEKAPSAPALQTRPWETQRTTVTPQQIVKPPLQQDVKRPEPPMVRPPVSAPAMPKTSTQPTPQPQTRPPEPPQRITVPFVQKVESMQKPRFQSPSVPPVQTERPSTPTQAPRPQAPQMPPRPPLPPPPSPSLAPPTAPSPKVELQEKNFDPSTGHMEKPKDSQQADKAKISMPPAGLPIVKEETGKNLNGPLTHPSKSDPYREQVE